MDQTLTPAQQRARLHQLLDTLPDAAVVAWLQLLDASGTPTTAPACATRAWATATWRPIGSSAR